MVIKPKKCKWSKCGKEFIPNRTTQKVCNYVCAVGYNHEKLEEKERKKTNELVKAFKENTKTLANYKFDLQTTINKIVRLIDKGHPCISSGANNYTMHAGHYFSVGGHENLRFNLLNIFGQSDAENTWKSGNETMYRKGLIKTFGIELMNEIDDLQVRYHYLGLRKSDIIEANFVARRIVKELEEENKYYTTKERIILRKQFNNRIGIYEN